MNMHTVRKTFTALLLAALLCAGLLGGAGRLFWANAAAPLTGYVYEAVRTNRIEGAIVTLYRETGDGGRTVLSSVRTDGDGAFSFGAAAGDLGVWVEHPGCRPAYVSVSGSGTLPVPLVTTGAPELLQVLVKNDYLTLVFSQYMDPDTVNGDTLVFYKNGTPLYGDVWPSDSEIAAPGSYQYYATSFNFETKRDITEVTSVTVQDVRNYAGIALSGTRSVGASAFVPAKFYHPGDLDGDGALTAGDARLALRTSVGLPAEGADLTPGSASFLQADRNKNGEIDAADARTLLRAAVGLESLYTNSPLVTYTNLSENRDPRISPIDRITIHHMSEIQTAKECCDYFQGGDREVSANYCIGWDGSVGLSVPEEYRAWTSSSEANDMRAVTIEVSNDGYGPDWHVSDASLEELISLCVDICLRNGIEKLVYTGDTRGNLTMHKWFAATDCPGRYLESRFPYIAQRVNNALAAP